MVVLEGIAGVGIGVGVGVRALRQGVVLTGEGVGDSLEAGGQLAPGAGGKLSKIYATIALAVVVCGSTVAQVGAAGTFLVKDIEKLHCIALHCRPYQVLKGIGIASGPVKLKPTASISPQRVCGRNQA
jgi:hypothetical protein